MVHSDTSSRLHALRERIDTELAGLVTRAEPVRLYDPVQYVLEGKGKRLRPLLTLLTSDIFGCEEERAMNVALSLEVFHAFTLVHDDIMDRSELRRGRETVHNRWDEATAILCGDFLSGLSTSLLSRDPHDRLQEMLQLHHNTLRLLCEGQILDMTFEDQPHVPVSEYLSMIDKKTAALLECSLQMGGLLGTANEAELAILKDIGWHMGRAFQIQDDLLDLTASSEKWGKAIGGDLVSGKKTYISLKALESSDESDRGYFLRILDRPNVSKNEIIEARDKMRDLGVLEDAETTVIFHSEKAIESVLSFPEGDSRSVLTDIIRSMQNRLH